MSRRGRQATAKLAIIAGINIDMGHVVWLYMRKLH